MSGEALATTGYTSWDDVRRVLTSSEHHRMLVIPKASVPDPSSAGALRSIGLPRGQSADFRFPPDAACQGVHVQDFGDSWRVHLDLVHPACSILDHVRSDTPRLGAYVSATALGALAGGVYKGPRGAIVGASAGILASLLVDFAVSCAVTRTPVKDDGQ